MSVTRIWIVGSLFFASMGTVDGLLANIIDDTHGVGAGSFELGKFINGGGNPPTGLDYMGLLPGDDTTITGWSVGGPGDGVDWLITPTFAADTGVHSIDLSHTMNGSISTQIPTDVGRRYRLTFSTAAWVVSGGQTGDVSAGSLVNEPFSAELSDNLADQTFTPFVFVFTATESTTNVTFTSTDENTGYGPVVDSVSVIVEPTCDFNDDGFCNIDDIDALIMEMAAMTNGPAFDLNGDGLVNLADRNDWLAEAGAMNLPSQNPYLPADFNLDGLVDGPDFLIWNANKFLETGKWSRGDANGDGLTGGLDYVIWNSNKFMSSDSVSAVPEPESGLITMVALGLLGLARARRPRPRGLPAT